MLTISFYKEPHLKRVYKSLDISRRKEIVEELRKTFRKEIERSQKEVVKKPEKERAK
jgi:hypothetical protein